MTDEQGTSVALCPEAERVLDWDGSGPELDDEELTALALAADPDQPVADDAVPLSFYDQCGLGFLPTWYMPPVVARRARGIRVPIVVLLVSAFLLVDAFGLCMTYGSLTLA